MDVIKKINNNVVLCVDSNGKELIAFGKGIGFPAIPYILNDLALIDRTFYCINQEYLHLLKEIPEQIFKLSARIFDYARQEIHVEIDDSLYFTLVDHINFAYIRAQQNMYLKTRLSYDIQAYYRDEMEVGKWAVKYLNKELNVMFPNDEASNIAMHVVEAENRTSVQDNIEDSETIVKDVTDIIQEEFNIKIDMEKFNYSRFVSHLQYLLLRSKKDESIVSENRAMFDAIKIEYPKAYTCAKRIKVYFTEKLNWTLSDEELLYLMLHINRLCFREDCNR